MKTRIIICMGSSCFVRGNSRNLETVENFLKEHGLTDGVEVEVSGRLCSGNCADGPVVIVDDAIYHRVDRAAMLDILEKHLLARR